jgi:glycosyltransferase involved in cell wall biosynthesis
VIPTVVFVWENFGPYHMDRLAAAARSLAGKYRVVGVEIAGSSRTYAWDRSPDLPGVERITLFPDEFRSSIPAWRGFLALARVCLRLRPRYVFLCNYEKIEVFLLAALLRLSRRSVHIMIDSKFDDKPRNVYRELLKAGFYLPYASALVSGPSTREYLRLYGFPPSRIEIGYDTVSVERVRRLAGAPPAPQGLDFASRHFTIVARLVPKKNLHLALEAYALYRGEVGAAARSLHICGNGPLEGELRRRAQTLGLTQVEFHGFLQAPEIARMLASTLALILPSTEEQWGLAINEAVAMGVPILCSDIVGAHDLLVRTAINGYCFEPDNALGLARLMQRLAADEREWRALAEGSVGLAPLADIGCFAVGVARLLGAKGGAAPGIERPPAADVGP